MQVAPAAKWARHLRPIQSSRGSGCSEPATSDALNVFKAGPCPRRWQRPSRRRPFKLQRSSGKRRAALTRASICIHAARFGSRIRSGACCHMPQCIDSLDCYRLGVRSAQSTNCPPPPLAHNLQTDPLSRTDCSRFAFHHPPQRQRCTSREP